MKRLLLLLCCLGASLVGASLSHALTIPASEDSFSSASRLSTAGNKSGVLSVDATRKAYVYFDLSEVPTTAVVRWAKLRLFLPLVRVKGSGVNVYTVTGEWNEALQSAEPAISSTPVGTIGADKLASKRFVTVDVTSTVQGWINLKTPNEGLAFVSIPNATPTLISAINFASKEGMIGGLPAELDIDFEPSGEVGTRVVLNGTTEPSPSLGNVGDFYINASASSIYGPKTASGWGSATSLIGKQGAPGIQGVKGDTGVTGPQGPIGLTGLQGIKGDNGATGPSGVQGLQGLTGATGATGPQGIQGVAGLDGRTVLNGTIAPSSSVGSTGDFYLNTAASALYGPKTASGWGSATSLVGPQGAQGAKGDTGAAGATGSQGPIGVTGPQGVKGDAGTPGPTGLQGPQGLTGATGPQGPTGATGPQGTAGSAAAAGTVLYRPYQSGEPPISAQTSGMNFQGVLIEEGQAATGTRNIEVKLFDSAIGGTEIYSESIGSVPIVNGVYSFEYGVKGTSNALMTETLITTDGTTLTFQKVLSASNVANGSVTVTDGVYTWSQAIGSSNENEFGVIYNSSLRRITINYYSGPPVAGRKINATYRTPNLSASKAISDVNRPWIQISVNGSVQSPRQTLLSVPFANVAQSVVGLDEVKSASNSISDEIGLALNFIQTINYSGISLPMHVWDTTKGGDRRGVNLLIQNTTHATFDVIGNAYVSQTQSPTENYNAGFKGSWGWVELSSGSVSACISAITFNAIVRNQNYNSVEARLYYEDGTFVSKTGISNGAAVIFTNPNPDKYVTKFALWGGTPSDQSQGASFSNAKLTPVQQDRYVDVDISGITNSISHASVLVGGPDVGSTNYSLFSGVTETPRYPVGVKSALLRTTSYQKLRIYLIPRVGESDLAGSSLQSISFRYWK